MERMVILLGGLGRLGGRSPTMMEATGAAILTAG
jgi:hypothetical protein